MAKNATTASNLSAIRGQIKSIAMINSNLATKIMCSQAQMEVVEVCCRQMRENVGLIEKLAWRLHGLTYETPAEEE